jgi:hypothetical protein
MGYRIMALELRLRLLGQTLPVRPDDTSFTRSEVKHPAGKTEDWRLQMNSATTLEVNGSDKQTEDARAPKKDPRLFVKAELSDDQLDQVSGGLTIVHNIFLDWRYDA